MKRITAVLLALVMATAFSVFVAAEEQLPERSVANEELIASELKELGLFKGVSNTDFDLDRPPSRVEALVMLIRVLGKEEEAIGGTWRHPFGDVPSWADSYVGYAYVNRLTNGQTATEFGSGNASAAMYLTFVLRALGYSDENGKDFVWSDPFTLSRELGLVDSAVNIENFWRADVVLVSHKALEVNIKDTQQTLAQKLIAAGIFNRHKYDKVYGSSTAADNTVKGFSAEQIYAECSSAVFYVQCYDEFGDVIGSGSGFFIDDKGTAVTNYHVIEGIYSAKIQTTYDDELYDVLGVYDLSVDNDWAIIQVDCDDTPYLDIGDPSTVVGGALIYTIGSPEALQNSISEGLISNVSREIGNRKFIQISAPISHGSSGGALINKFGEVIGVTTAIYAEGQNLNFAIPMTNLANYDSSKLYKLETIFVASILQGVDLDNRQEIAYAFLKDFITRWHHSYEDGYYYYRNKVVLDDEEHEYQILLSLEYDEENGEILADLIHYYDEDETAYSIIVPFTKSENYNSLMLYSNGAYDGEEYEVTTYGTFWCIHSEVQEYYDLEFTKEYEGYVWDRNKHEDIAFGLLCDLLSCINLLLEDNYSWLEKCTVADFGYTRFYG